MEAKYRAGPVPRAGGPFLPGFRPLPARLGPCLAVLYPVKGLFPPLLCRLCVFHQMYNSPRCVGPVFPPFLTQQKWGIWGKVSLSSVPGLHCSGEGVNLPIGDSLLGRGGGSGEEIVATLISTLVSASHCSPWGSEVMEGLSLGLPMEEGAVT